MRPSGRIPYIPGMKPAHSLALLPVLASCAGPGVSGEPAVFELQQKATVILEIVDGHEMPDVPEDLAWSRFSRSESSGDRPLGGLIVSADSAGKLLMLIESEPGTELQAAARQHMFITLDDWSRPVRVSPEGLALDLQDSTITPGPAGHRTLLLLLGKYRPDLLFISMDDPGPDSLSALLSFWSESAATRDFRFVLLSAPAPGSRGWCVMSWRGIRGGFVPGLSFGGFGKTLAILAGLPWDRSVFSGVPAAVVLSDAGV